MKNRRAFLMGSAALAAGAGAVGLNVATRGLAAAQNSAVSSDAMVLELRRQFRAALPGLRKADGESARQYAVALRTFVAYAKTRDFDGQVRRALRRVIAERGRAEVLDMTPNHAEMEAKVRDLGGTDEDVDILHAPADIRRKELALDGLLKEGLTPAMERLAAMLERGAAGMDRNSGNIRTVAQSQGSSCEEVCGYADLIRDYMDLVCAMVALFPIMADVCIAAIGAWTGALAACGLCKIGQYFWG
jgi:hypothetical protein